MPDIMDQVIDYEMGSMDLGAVIEFSQRLIDSGLAWQLQGHYGHTAQALINQGLCSPKREV